MTPIGPTSNNSGTTFTYSDPTHSYVLRNGGQILSFAPPNQYLLPTAGTTPSSQVNGAVEYYQSKCRVTPSGAEQTESIGWLDLYPTLTTESLAINQTGGCGFPLTFDVTNASSMLANIINATIISGKHFSGMSTSVPTVAAGTGAGTSPTLSLNANSNDLSGYLSVATGTSPAAGATVATLTFGTPYSTLAKCLLSPANGRDGSIEWGRGWLMFPWDRITAFTVVVGHAPPLAAATLYTWGYTCTQ